MIKKGLLTVLLLSLVYLVVSRLDAFSLNSLERTIAVIKAQSKPNTVQGKPKFVFKHYTLTDLDLPEPEQRYAALSVDPAIRQELLAMLKAGQFPELDARIEKEALRYDRSEIREFELGYVTQTVIDPSLEPMFEEWVASTGSWASNMAMAKYLDRMAWQWRGSRFIRYVALYNQKKFSDAQDKIILHHNAAKQSNKRDAIWFANNIEYIKQSGASSRQELIHKALEMFPNSTGVLSAVIDAQSARWGGNATRQADLIKRLAILKDGNSSEDSATMNMYLSRAAARSRNVPSAISYIKNAIRQKPSRLEYFTTLARYYWQQDQLSEAITLLNVILEYWPQSTTSLRLRADIYADFGELELARRDIDFLLSYSPYHREANMTALKIYALQDDKEAAKQGFERASYFTLYDADQWVKLGAKAEYEFKDKELGKHYYQKALDLDPIQPAAHYSFAKFHHEAASCEIVQNLFGYLEGCASNNRQSKNWCTEKRTEWILSYVDFLQNNNQRSEIGDYDFSNLTRR